MSHAMAGAEGRLLSDQRLDRVHVARRAEAAQEVIALHGGISCRSHGR